MKKLSLTLPAIAVGLSAPVLTTVPLSVSAQLEEVIVTARQREETLQDVPASITAFTGTDIDRAGIQRAGDFANLTPGVNLTNSAEVGDTQLSIRGINGARDAEVNFAFIIDGILYTNPSAFNREFANVSQIEVLKGPQGALYGRSAASGAIIVTTKKPGEEFEGEINVGAGNYNSYTVDANVSGALIPGQLYGSVGADYRTSDGFYQNQFISPNTVDDFEQYNVNGRLLWEPNDRLTADAKFRYGEVDAASIAFNAAFALPPFAPGIGPDAFKNVNDHDFVFSNNIDPENEQETKEFSIKVDYEMDWATATGWFLYSDQEQYLLADGTSGAFGFFFGDQNCLDTTAAANAANTPVSSPTFIGPTPAASLYPPYSPTTCDGGQYQERNQEDMSFEFRLTSPGDQPLRWNVGFYWLDIEREVGVAQTTDNAATGSAAGISAQNIRSFNSPATEALVHDRFDTTVYSVFGSIAYDVSDDVELALAVRYDREEREVTNLVTPPDQPGGYSEFIDYTDGVLGPDDGIVGSPLNPAFVDFNTGAISNSIPPRDEVFSQFQPKVSATWDVNDEWTLFASWGIGFKSGGFNNLGAREVVNFFVNPALVIGDTYNEETSSAFEVGFKSSLAGGRVDLEGALFYTEIDDMQFFEFFVGPFGLQRVVTTVDEVSIVGGELNANAAVTDALQVYAGLSIVNGKIDKNTNRPITEGNDIPYAPDFTFNMGAEYVKPWFDGIDFVGRVDYRITGPTWFHTVQDDVVPAFLFGGPPADFSRSQRETFSLINLRAGLESDKWSAYAWVRNLTDEQYLEEVIPAPEFGGSFVHPATQRAFGVEVGYRF